jgi:ribonuclease R
MEWPGKRRNPEGRVKEILGKKGEKGIDILTIIKKFKLPEEFPPKVQKFAQKIPNEIKKRNMQKEKI